MGRKGSYDVTWSRLGEGVLLKCHALDVRTLVARLIQATGEGGVVVHCVEPTRRASIVEPPAESVPVFCGCTTAPRAWMTREGVGSYACSGCGEPLMERVH